MPPEIGPKKGKSIFEMPPTLLFHGLTWLQRDNEQKFPLYQNTLRLWSEAGAMSNQAQFVCTLRVLLFPRSENCDACLFPILLSLEIGSISAIACERGTIRTKIALGANFAIIIRFVRICTFIGSSAAKCSQISPFVLRMRDRAQIAHWLSSQVCKRSIDCTLERLCVNTVIRSCSLRFSSTLHLFFRSRNCRCVFCDVINA